MRFRCEDYPIVSCAGGIVLSSLAYVRVRVLGMGIYSLWAFAVMARLSCTVRVEGLVLSLLAFEREEMAQSRYSILGSSS